MPDWLSLPELDTLQAGAVYAVLFTMIFAESGLLVGFFLPGDTILFTAGLLAAEPGSELSLPVLMGGVFVAAVAGDSVGYASGRRYGRPWVLRRAGRAAAHVERAEVFYERYGWFALVAARFIPWVRTLTPIVAGVARMPYRRFLSANVTGAVVWGAGLVALGYVAHSVPAVRWVAYTVAGLSVLASVIAPVVGRLRSRRRAAQPAVPVPVSTAGGSGAEPTGSTSPK